MNCREFLDMMDGINAARLNRNLPPLDPFDWWISYITSAE